MTEFSYPSELVDPYPDVDTWFFGSIARATTDIAVAAWTSQRYNQDLAPLAPMHLAAIRYTDTGPEMGETLTVANPSEIMIYRVVEGQDKQVWVLGADSADAGIKLGLVTVDVDTLAVSFQWKHTIPSRRNPGYGGGVMAASWPDMGLIVIATNEGRPDQADLDSPWVHVVDMATGAVIESVQTPRYDPDNSSDYNRVYPQGIALHKESGRLLICGNWYSRTTYVARAALWTIEVSTSGLGDWTKVCDVPRMGPEYYSYSLRWVTMAATERGWTILLMSTYGWGGVRWFHLTLGGVITSTTDDPITWDGSTNSYNNLARPFDCAYDAAYDRAIACYMEWGSWFYSLNPDGVYLQGFMHMEGSGSMASVSAMTVLPRSENADSTAIVNVAVVAPGHYIYLCASAGILQPRGSQYYDSFGPIVYVGGDGSTVDFVSAHLGGQVDDSRRAFRTVT